MTPRSLIANGLRTVLRAVEGASRPGPYYLPVSGGWLPDGSALNWWQLGENIIPSGSRSAMVEACVSAYSQTIAMCPGDHWRTNAKGGRDRVKNSALSRVLRQPNEYQSMSDFMLNATRQLYLDGNAYALALRNDRFEIDAIHLMDSAVSFPQVAVTGDVFYRLHGNAIIEKRMQGEPLIVPQRDVLHLRLHVDRTRRYPFPLWGQTPLLAALNDISVTEAISQQQLNYYMNQARPSAVLQTDLTLDKDQVQALRDRWDDQSRGLNQGKTPILTSGLKVTPWSTAPRDAQLAEIMKITEEHIALAFRIPLQLLGMGGSTFGSTEALMQFWISTGLGFALNHVEEAFGLLFGLKGQPDEYTEFDTSALLRSAMKDRVEALARGVQGGIYSPNEARKEEGLPEVAAGAEPRVQAQVVPLSAADKIPTAPSSHTPGSAPAAPGSSPSKPEPIRPAQPTPPKASRHDIERAARSLVQRAGRIGRQQRRDFRDSA